eukprot:jgi/Bigna1/76689/fgenesh1_pg.43_\
MAVAAEHYSGAKGIVNLSLIASSAILFFIEVTVLLSRRRIKPSPQIGVQVGVTITTAFSVALFVWMDIGIAWRPWIILSTLTTVVLYGTIATFVMSLVNGVVKNPFGKKLIFVPIFLYATVQAVLVVLALVYDQSLFVELILLCHGAMLLCLTIVASRVLYIIRIMVKDGIKSQKSFLSGKMGGSSNRRCGDSKYKSSKNTTPNNNQDRNRNNISFFGYCSSTPRKGVAFEVKKENVSTENGDKAAENDKNRKNRKDTTALAEPSSDIKTISNDDVTLPSGHPYRDFQHTKEREWKHRDSKLKSAHAYPVDTGRCNEARAFSSQKEMTTPGQNAISSKASVAASQHRVLIKPHQIGTTKIEIKESMLVATTCQVAETIVTASITRKKRTDCQGPSGESSKLDTSCSNVAVRNDELDNTLTDRKPPLLEQTSVITVLQTTENCSDRPMDYNENIIFQKDIKKENSSVNQTLNCVSHASTRNNENENGRKRQPPPGSTTGTSSFQLPDATLPPGKVTQEDTSISAWREGGISNRNHCNSISNTISSPPRIIGIQSDPPPAQTNANAPRKLQLLEEDETAFPLTSNSCHQSSSREKACPDNNGADQTDHNVGKDCHTKGQRQRHFSFVKPCTKNGAPEEEKKIAAITENKIFTKMKDSERRRGRGMSSPNRQTRTINMADSRLRASSYRGGGSGIEASGYGSSRFSRYVNRRTSHCYSSRREREARNLRHGQQLKDVSTKLCRLMWGTLFLGTVFSAAMISIACLMLSKLESNGTESRFSQSFRNNQEDNDYPLQRLRIELFMFPFVSAILMYYAWAPGSTIISSSVCGRRCWNSLIGGCPWLWKRGKDAGDTKSSRRCSAASRCIPSCCIFGLMSSKDLFWHMQFATHLIDMLNDCECSGQQLLHPYEGLGRFGSQFVHQHRRNTFLDNGKGNAIVSPSTPAGFVPTGGIKSPFHRKQTTSKPPLQLPFASSVRKLASTTTSYPSHNDVISEKKSENVAALGENRGTEKAEIRDIDPSINGNTSRRKSSALFSNSVIPPGKKGRIRCSSSSSITMSTSFPPPLVRRTSSSTNIYNHGSCTRLTNTSGANLCSSTIASADNHSTTEISSNVRDDPIALSVTRDSTHCLPSNHRNSDSNNGNFVNNKPSLKLHCLRSSSSLQCKSSPYSDHMSPPSPNLQPMSSGNMESNASLFHFAAISNTTSKSGDSK